MSKHKWNVSPTKSVEIFFPILLCAFFSLRLPVRGFNLVTEPSVKLKKKGKEKKRKRKRKAKAKQGNE